MGSESNTVIRDILSFFEDSLWNSPISVDLTRELLEEYKKTRRIPLKPSMSRSLQMRIESVIKSNVERLIGGERRYWLLIASRSNFEECLKHGLWGVEYQKHIIRDVGKGDLVFFYVKGERNIYGIFKVISDVFRDELFIWDLGLAGEGRRIFPYRVKIRMVTDLREVDFKYL